MMDAKEHAARRCLPLGAVLAASLGAVETLSQRRRQVEEMSAEQRDELFRNEQQFRDLPPQDSSGSETSTSRSKTLPTGKNSAPR